MNNSEQAALIVAQQAIALLLKWAGAELPQGCCAVEDGEAQNQAIVRAKALLGWPDQTKIGSLSLLFERVRLHNPSQPPSSEAPDRPALVQPDQGQLAPVQPDQDQPNQGQPARFWQYVGLAAIADLEPPVPYPLSQKPDQEPDLAAYRQAVGTGILTALTDPEQWGNLSLLMLLLEKYGSCLRFGEADVALIDQVRIVDALAASLAEQTDAAQLCLIAGDLSGIQNFIYTISSDGALKSLRARSFYLELLTEEIVQQLLGQLQLPRVNVIYAGGGNLYLLAPASAQTQAAIRSVRQQFNGWLFREFQGKISLALEALDFPIADIATAKFADHWAAVSKRLAVQKQQKFRDQIDQVLRTHISYEQCRVCHRDDVRKLTVLDADSTVQACPTCARMFRLGGQLLRIQAIVRSNQVSPTEQRIRFKLPNQVVYYRLFNSVTAALQAQNPGDTVFLINNWTPDAYQSKTAVPLLLGNYGQVSRDALTDDRKQPGMMRAEEFAEYAQGIQRVGYLRMDVDRLGRIFAEGLGADHSLPRLAGLSRQISYFFKVYLNQLAKQRSANLLFIYAGGDDLFISGCWNEIVEFGFEVYQAFRQYTGENQDITLSGGISLAGPKFPLYQAAGEAGEAEHRAKENGRDSLGLFGEAFKWSEWLGTAPDLSVAAGDAHYLQAELKPQMFGVLPFVERLSRLLDDKNLARSFVRNLLLTAQLQEQAIADYKERHQLESAGRGNEPTALKDLRYYLHLPKIAYTLARSPKKIQDDQDLRESFLSPYNAPYFRAIATWIELLNRSGTAPDPPK